MALKYRAYRTCQWIDTTSTAQKIWGFWKLNITRQHSTMTTSVIARRLQGTQTGPEYRTQSMHRQTLDTCITVYIFTYRDDIVPEYRTQSSWSNTVYTDHTVYMTHTLLSLYPIETSLHPGSFHHYTQIQ